MSVERKKTKFVPFSHYQETKKEIDTLSDLMSDLKVNSTNTKANNNNVEDNFYIKGCQYVLDGKVCRKENCTFAHSLSQLRAPKCKFGEYCRNSKCTRSHGESVKEYYGVNLPNLPETHENVYKPKQKGDNYDYTFWDLREENRKKDEDEKGKESRTVNATVPNTFMDEFLEYCSQKGVKVLF